MKHVASDKYKHSLFVAFLIGIILGCLELAVVTLADIHFSWVVISGVAGIDFSFLEIILLKEKLHTPEEKIAHFIPRAMAFVGVALVGVLGMIIA